MSVMTKELEKEILTFNSQYNSIYLKADDHLVIITTHIEKLKIRLLVYVDGWINGIDSGVFKANELDKMTDIAKKFNCVKKIPIPKKKADYHKKAYAHTKKQHEQWLESSALYTVKPIYSSNSALLKKLKATCLSVEKLTYAEYSALKQVREAADAT